MSGTSESAAASVGAFALLVLVVAATLYGTSYQQFRHFDWNDSRGASDAASYARMARGDYDVDPIHAYRPVVPWLAGAVRGLLPQSGEGRPDELDKLSFYVVNFAFVLIAALLLFAILRELRFDLAMSAFGVGIFLTSRATVIATGVPLVDSYYFAALAAIVWLCLRPTRLALACTLPLVVLSKESIYPLALLPLFRREARVPLYALSLAASVALVFFVRAQIGPWMSDVEAYEKANDLLSVIVYHVGKLGMHAAGTLSARGLHDLFHGVTVFAAFAAVGWWRDRKRETPRLPPFLALMIPLMLFYAILSGTRGRQFFTAFPVLIPYALLFFEDLRRRWQTTRAEPGAAR